MRLTISVLGVCALAGTLAACSGGGSGIGSTTPPISSVDPSSMNQASTSSAPSSIAQAPLGAPAAVGSSAQAPGASAQGLAKGMTAEAAPTAFTGTILSIAGSILDVQTDTVAGKARVYLESSTTISGPKIFVGEHIAVTGTGSIVHGVTAKTIAQTGPLSTPPPNTPNTATMLTGTAGKIGVFQVFDVFGSGHEITGPEAKKDASRYSAVWGSRPGMPGAWSDGNPKIFATYYMPQETDAATDLWGNQGHTLAWWQKYRPNWVLYQCTAAGTPTRTAAYMSNLPTNVPLDIHNPDVVEYQVRLAANYAHTHGYKGLAFDEVLFYNETGNGTNYGCGIYEGSSFVRRYSGKRDANWISDTVAWVKAAHRLLTTDPTLSSYHLKLVVNHPAGPITNLDEQEILENVDAVVDETGFSDYGEYHNSPDLFKETVDWMNFAQAHGASPLIVDKYEQTSEINSQQLEYSIATYLMGHNGSSALFVGNLFGYGVENYHSQYASAVGVPCGAYTGGPAIYTRRFSGAVVEVNASTSDARVALPAGHSYRDIVGRPFSDTLTIAPGDGYVLLTSNGCAN